MGLAKDNKPASGYTVPRLVILILVITLAALAGWQFYQRRQNINTSNQQTNPYAGWQTYDDGHVTFKYPSTWKITGTEVTPYVWVVLEGPEDQAIRLDNTNMDGSTASNKRLALNIGPTANGDLTCREPCKVHKVLPLNMSNAPNAKIVISEWDGIGPKPVIIQVVDDLAVQVGSDTYAFSSQVDNRRVSIYADVRYDRLLSGGWIDDVEEFVQTQSFQDLVKIIQSINIK